MTGKAQFSEQEWRFIEYGPQYAAAAIVKLDFGITGISDEIAAYREAVKKAKASFGHLELVQAMFGGSPRPAAPPPTEPGTIAQVSYGHQVEVSGEVTLDFPFAGSEELLGKIAEAARAVSTKASPDEAAAFKQIVYSVADAVANAASEGFLGRGKKVSDKEAAFLQKLRATLAL